MAKPAVTFRNTKGSALTYTELDTNFQNLRDATIGFTVGSDNADIDLNSRLTVTAGSGISLTLNPSTDTLTIASTTTSNIFNTIAVAGQSNIVADSTTDTLTVAAGNNIAITTDASTDTLTIAASDVVTTNTTQTVTGAKTFSATTTLGPYVESVYSIGNSGSGTVTPNFANGPVQTVTATGNFTLALPSNMVAGSNLTLIITQDSTGGRTFTPNASYKFANGSKTLSASANSIDVMTIYYDGSRYLSSLIRNYS